MALFYSVRAFSCDIYQKLDCFIHLGFDLFGMMNTSDCHWLIIGSPLLKCQVRSWEVLVYWRMGRRILKLCKMKREKTSVI